MFRVFLVTAPSGNPNPFLSLLIQENNSITSVDLADNLIKEAGAEALAAMLKVFFPVLFLFSCFSEHSAMFWLPPASPR